MREMRSYIRKPLVYTNMSPLRRLMSTRYKHWCKIFFSVLRVAYSPLVGYTQADPYGEMPPLVQVSYSSSDSDDDVLELRREPQLLRKASFNNS